MDRRVDSRRIRSPPSLSPLVFYSRSNVNKISLERKFYKACVPPLVGQIIMYLYN